MATTTLVTGARASRSTITLKLLMAASGIVFILFVLLHMYGNLKAFAGHDAYNEYAHHLRTLGEPMLPYEGLLVDPRAALIVALVARLLGLRPVDRASKARTQRYVVKKQPRVVVLLALDALGRRDDPAVPGLAPAELHRRQGQRHRWGDQRPRTTSWSTRSTPGG